MNQKKDINSNHETIDEQKMIENLLDGNAKQSDSQTKDTQDSKQRQVIYTKQVGCFDIKSIIINLIVYTLVLMVTSGWFDGFYVENAFAALNTALVMSALNIILKPIIVLLTLPLTIITFGLFYVIINGLILWIADYLMGTSFEIHSFGVAIIASIFISLLRMGINHYLLKQDSIKIYK